MATHDEKQRLRVLIGESTSCKSQAAARRLQDQMVSRGVQEDHVFQRSGDEGRGQDGEEEGDIPNWLSRNATNGILERLNPSSTPSRER